MSNIYYHTFEQQERNWKETSSAAAQFSREKGDLIIYNYFHHYASRLCRVVLTVTNCMSNLVKYFYTLRKITPLWASVLNFRGWLVKFLTQIGQGNHQKGLR